MADRERDGYVLTTDRDRVDVETVHRWLSQDAYWSLGRPREVVEATVRTCDVWSVFAPDGAQETAAGAEPVRPISWHNGAGELGPGRRPSA